ncbi:MAG: N-methyl-L-tryptophan oxidase [Betaproteobacteria bacterium]
MSQGKSIGRAEVPEVLIVGLGAMGSATLYQLARRGVDAVGIDRYSPPHTHGSTHGETRITREAVGEGAAFVPLAMRSHLLWRDIERDTGRQLFRQCGGLILAAAGEHSPLHEQRDFLGSTIALAAQFGIAHELLDAGAMQARFPPLQLTGNESGYLEPGAGYLLPETCVSAQLDLARAHGARIQCGEQVRSIKTDARRATVETDRAIYQPGVTIVCAGPWLPGLLAGRLPRPLVVRRQVLHWFEAADPAAYAAERFPIFIWHWGSAGTEVFYGFPDVGGGVKVATEQLTDATTPDTVARDVDPAESEAMFNVHVAGRLRGLKPRATRAATCLYTNSADARFLIDRLPDCEGVIVVSACSGHGFKHSAAIGEAVAEMAITGRTPDVLKAFSA